MKALAVCALLVCGATSAGAQAPSGPRPDAPVIRLRPIVVQATMPFATSGGASALEVEMDSLRISPAPTVERVMRQMPFVQVRTNARGEAYFGVRGSGFDAREVAVLLDGLPISLGFDHRADLSVLPAGGARRVTFVRGIPSLLYGPNVLGGVVDVDMSESPDGNGSGRISSGIDQTGSYATDIGVGLPRSLGRGRLLMKAGGGYRGSDGFPLPGSVQEPSPFNGRDLRLNSDRTQYDGFASARFDASGGAWASLAASGYSASRGTPAELNTTSAKFWRYPLMRRAIAMASAGTASMQSPLGGRARLQGAVGYDVGRTDVTGYTSRTYATVTDRERDDDHNITGRFLGTQTIGSRGDLSAALTYADVRRNETLTPGAASVYEQKLWSGAIESGWRIAGVRLAGGLSHDEANTPRSGDKPVVPTMSEWGGRFGVTRALGSSVLLHAGVGRRARFPALRELYSGQLKMFEPNPDLRPEVLVASEAGATAQMNQTQLQAVVFHHRIDDQIVRSVTAAKKVKRINRDRTDALGLELLATTGFRSAAVSVDLTAQSVGGSDPAAQRDFRPEYQPKWMGGVRLDTPLPASARFNAGTHVTGAQYCLDTSGAYKRLDKTTRVDAEVSRVWRLNSRSGWFEAMEGSIAADNLSDAAIFDQCGLPQAGRLLRVQVRLR